MTLDPAKIALLEEWLQGKEGEHLEFKCAELGLPQPSFG